MILLIDRDPDTRFILRSVLEWSDHEVLEASDAATARRMMQMLVLRLVIMEHPLPVEGGPTLLHAARSDAHTAALPILVTTSSPALVAEALGLGCDRVLVKPFSPARALEEVRRLLEASGSSVPGALMLMTRDSAGGAQTAPGPSSPPPDPPQEPASTSPTGKDRDPRLERMERESFIVLQHLYTITGGNPTRWMQCAGMRAALGLTQEEMADITRHLVAVELVAGDGESVAISRDGIGYIERLAWRRRTVRT